MATLDDLRKTLTQRKSVLSRHINTLAKSMDTGLASHVVARVEKLRETMNNIEDLHDQLVCDLVDEDLRKQTDCFAALESEFFDAVKRATDWLTEKEKPNVKLVKNSDVGDDSMKALAQIVSLPKIDLEPFSGDALKFHSFMNSFRVNIESVCTDPNTHLAHLLASTRGLAHEAIRGCQIIGGQKGYERALDILKESFGEDQAVIDRVVSELLTDESLRSPEQVLQFSYKLSNARDILLELEAEDEVDSQIVLQRIVQCLPQTVRMRWRDKQLASKRKSKCYLDFEELVKFVKQVADEMNDPLYGQSKLNRLDSKQIPSSPKKPGGKPKEKTLASVSVKPQSKSKKTSKVKCKLCNGEHFLSRCANFKEMSVSQRTDFANQRKVCINCLSYDHTVHNCLSNNRCFVCKGMHSVFLHVDIGSVVNSTTHQRALVAFMPIVKVQVNDRAWVHAALDSCSSGTFCSKALARDLSLRTSPCAFTLDTLSGESHVSSQFVSLKLSSGSESMVISGVKLVDKIPVTSGNIDLSQYPHLQGIDISANIDCKEVQLLIGQDCADAMIPLAVRRGKPNDPYAVQYKFGWALNGKGCAQTECVNHNVICHWVSSASPNDERAADDVSKLWSIEHDYDVERTEMSIDEKRVISLWDRTCTVEDNHFVLPIPWKDERDPLPNNFDVAKGRLDSLVKRLRKESLYDRYDSEIGNLLAEGYAELVPRGSIDGQERIWYLPHHNVHNPNKPEKLRIVFDCASPFRGRSLNDRVFQGPDLINGAFDVLLRFRMHAYAVQSDIKAMYLQVKVAVSDRDALRFLWYKDDQLMYLRMTSHLFGGIWCSAVSTYALRRTILDFAGADPLMRHAILNCTYVDDCLVSVSQRGEALSIILELPKILETRGFILTKFVVNDLDLIDEIPEQHRGVEIRDPSNSLGKALGVPWDVGEDIFLLDAPPGTMLQGHLTRRSMLKYVASAYDPLGLSLPWLIKGRMLFQRATSEKTLGWDQDVPSDVEAEWMRWISDMKSQSALAFPRCVKESHFDDAYHECHVFCDASMAAYGTCVYLRCGNSFGEISSRLIVAKAHVAPTKQMTIPRLELQAAQKAALIATVVKREMGLLHAPTFFWSDSMIVLGYIKNDSRRFRTFVANRVGLIRSLSSADDWYHVPSEENPADLLTKYQPRSWETDLWKHGPTWLNRHNPLWTTKSERVEYSVGDDDPEVSLVAATSPLVTSNLWTSRLCDRYSSWVFLLRAVAWVLRFCKYLRNKSAVSRKSLVAEELKDAERLICSHVQHQHFAKEIASPSAKSSPIYSLRPYLDTHRLLCVGGRTGQHPIILPHDSVATMLLARHFHEISHSGIEWSLALLRERFWVVKGRKLMKRVVQKCIECKKMFAPPANQLMAELPPDRITPNLPPFTQVGIDAFGPFYVKRKRSSEKRYGCIFTCFVSRAIHLEMLESLDADAFLNAFRRFVARRGKPITVYSDNGKNFVAGEKELKHAFLCHTKGNLLKYGTNAGIRWFFNPPSAPHMGGVWERLVGVTKRVLRAVLGSATRLTDEILTTALCEAESIVNGRPLTKLSEDPNDLTPLTPNHLLLLREQDRLPPAVSSTDSYRHRWRYIQHLANQFWARFVKEYLPELQKRSKWLEDRRNISVGEIVLVKERGLPRNLWPLGLIVTVQEGRDARVRSVIVKTKGGKFRRPIVDLVPLELSI